MKKILLAFILLIAISLTLTGCMGDAVDVTVVLKNASGYELKWVIFDIPPSSGTYNPHRKIITAEDVALKPDEEREVAIGFVDSDFGNSGGALIGLKDDGSSDNLDAAKGEVVLERGINRFVITHDGEQFVIANADDADIPNTPVRDEDLPAWNGYDFGPNLEYSEEYTPEGDPGEYLSTFEAAKLVFTTVKEKGNIPEESDSTEYTMVLTGIETIGESNEECYIYRLEIAEPDGMVGDPSYAYAYQSGNLYMQDDESQWVLVYSGIGGLFSTDKERAEYIIRELTKAEVREIEAKGGKPDYVYTGEGEIGGGRAWYFDLEGGNTEQYSYAVNEWGEIWGMDAFGKWQLLPVE